VSSLLVLIFVVVVLCVVGSEFDLYLGGLVIIFALSALGLDWLMGRTGQVSIGNGPLMAIGAYTTAIISRHPWAPFPVPVIIAGLIGAGTGLVIALPSLRLRGFYFALTTLALQFIVQFAAETYETDSGNFSGLTVKPIRVFGHSFNYGVGYVALLSVILVLTVVLLSNMYKRLPGRMWRAIKESELAASTIQVSVRRWKLTSFVGSSGLIAVAGSLFAYYTGLVSSDTFTLTFAISFVVMTIVGGMNSMAGAIVGAAVVTLSPQLLTSISGHFPQGSWVQRDLPAINSGLYGVLVLLVLLYLPTGIAPSLQNLGGDGAKRLRRLWGDSPAAPITQKTGIPESPPTNGLHSSSATLSPQAQRHGSGDRSPAPSGEERDERSTLVQGSEARTLLTIHELAVKYANGATALNRVSLSIRENETVAVVGRNGAGKTTLLRSLGGFFGTEKVRRRGSVIFDGHEVIGATPVQAASLGIVLVPEREKVFPSLTVAEHLRHLGNAEVARSELPEVWEFLQRLWKSPAGSLSGGERQLLAISLAASLEPRLLMIDEMSLGLAPVMIERVTEVLLGLRQRDRLSLLIVEQNIAVAERLAQRVLHLENGELRPGLGTRPVDGDL